MKTLLILFIGLTTTVLAQDNIKFAETINIQDLERHLTILASDSLEGRETGKKGQKMAADYIMNHFKNTGILNNPKSHVNKFNDVFSEINNIKKGMFKNEK